MQEWRQKGKYVSIYVDYFNRYSEYERRERI